MILTDLEKNKLINCLPGLQDLDLYYQKLLWSDGIKDNDDKKTVAGMIAVMYQFQNAPEPAIAAAQWRITHDIMDEHGRPGQLYFDIGSNLILD